MTANHEGALDGLNGSRPRVCLLTETFFPILGGGENQARLLAARLVRRGFPVIVVTRRNRPDLASKELIDGITVRRVGPAGSPRYGKYLMLWPVCWWLLRHQASYDIVFVCGYRVLGPVAVAAGKLLRKRVVLKADCEGELAGAFIYTDPRIARSRVLAGLAGLAVAARNAILRRADLFISISRRIEEELLEHGVRPEAIRRIPNGVETERFRPATPQEKQQARRALGISEDRLVVAYSGKLNRYKGLERLLNVWKDVTARYPQGYLLLIGSGDGQYLSCEGALRRYVAEHGLADRVAFTGFVVEVHRYLQAADFFVFPSEREGFPLAPLEALACGLPVVASRVGAITEVINGGSNGLLVEPGDAEALREALCRLLEHRALAESLGKNGPRTAELFQLDRVADAYVTAFQSLVGANGAARMQETAAR